MTLMIEEKICEHIVQDKLEQLDMIESISNLLIYSERIQEYSSKKEHVDDVVSYEKAITILKELCVKAIKRNKESSKKRYESGETPLENSFYFEIAPENTKDFPIPYNNEPIFGIFRSNVCSLENNKKFLFNSICHDKYLVEIYEELFGKFTGNEKDLYFDTYCNLSLEEKIQFIKNDVEFTHIAVAPENNFDIALMVKGKYNYVASEVIPTSYTNFTNSNLEKLKEEIKDNVVISWYNTLVKKVVEGKVDNNS